MRTFFLLLLLGGVISASAQNNFHIKGKIERVSGSSSVIISGSVTATGTIQKDGSFEIVGFVTDPGTVVIRTDSSTTDLIWLEPGEYNLECKEIQRAEKNQQGFRIPSFSGPLNASLFYGFIESRFSIPGNSRDQVDKNMKAFSILYLDSLINYHSNSPVIGEVLRLSSYHIGDEATNFYMSYLNNDHKKQSGFGLLENYFKRQNKIKKEVFFTDFSMKNQYGRLFRLSSLKKKLVLIDFWSSDCYSCRIKHIGLQKLYQQYASKGLEIVSISLDEKKNEWLKAIAKDNMKWINVSELNGWDNSVAVSYFINALPFGIWLDKDRKIIATEKLSEEEIEKLLSE